MAGLGTFCMYGLKKTSLKVVITSIGVTGHEVKYVIHHMTQPRLNYAHATKKLKSTGLIKKDKQCD